MIEHVEQRLGNYRLIQLLGKGAFADVYLGEHLYLNTPVAIKVLRSPLDSPTLADFLSEARHVSQLVHPHIIRVFDFGLEAQACFLVMDYAPFGNLRQLHPAGMLVPLPIIVSYVRALASALQHAHDQHLVHRDLKPENVLLGHKYEVLLSDFGLAVLTSGSEPVQLTERFGTLAYMAPEQILGQSCPASDQYALAVMLYEWLSGQLPFAGSVADLSTQHLYASPASLCARHPEIPLVVEQVVFKGLSKDPTRRYVDVLSFATAFEEASRAVSPPHPHALASLSAATPCAARSSLDGRQMSSYAVPAPLTPLIGREQELHTARALLMRPEVRLVTLAGIGGIGKTHLALSLGIEVREAFARGVCFVSLAACDDPEQVLPAIAQALGLQEKGKPCTFDHLKTFLYDKQLLVLLDTFEQVLPAAPLLSELLSSCPQLKLLVTSRALLHVWGEYALTLAPLEVPDLHPLPACDVLSQVAAVALFVQRTQALLPGFQLTEENARAIAEICTRLEGVPLALELAAARSQLLPPQALLSRLDARIEVLTGGRRDAPLRQQTLRNTLNWTEDLLSPDEQTLLRRLAAFAGGCSLQAAEAISTALGGMAISVLDGVTALIDKSLLRQPAHDKDELRLYPLEMIREYGLERLAACGELEETREAHAAYYLALAEEAEATMPHATQRAWQHRLEREVDNVRVALEWLLERKQAEAALRLAAALRQFWALPGYLSEGRGFLQRALEACKEIDVAPRVRAKALYAAGWLACWQNDPRQATALLQESLRFFRSLGDKRGEACALTCLRTILHEHGEGGAAAAVLEEGVRRSREPGEHGDLPERVGMQGMQPGPPSLSGSPTGSSRRSLQPPAPLLYEELTAREIEVLRLLALGLSNSQIAARLVLSPHTVNGHIQSIYGKLGLNSRSAATRYALEHQLA